MLFLITGSLFAQNLHLKGKVTNEKGQPLPGVTILIKGTTKGTTTNQDGNYVLDASKGDVLQFSYIGFTTKLVKVGQSTTINVQLKSGVALNEVVVTGTRYSGRTALETAVPVDVLNVKSLTSVEPQVDMNQLLNYSVPSFSSNVQTISDGTDEVDPASLRGLGPDQVLVLVNGKRRHPSSLININGTFGRGNVGTDLNTIPTSAVSDIQVLRDGASAQYGSDAIAGVINIILRKNVGQLKVDVSSGAYASKNSNGLTGGIDGPTTNVSANYGIALGKHGGFINFTGAFNYRDYYNRMGTFSGEIFNAYNAVEWNAYKAGVDISNLSMSQIQQYAQQSTALSASLKTQINAATSISQLQSLLSVDVTDAELAERGLSRKDFVMRVGQSALRGGKFFFNMFVPIDKKGTELYSFGGSSYRRGDAAGFYRLPYQSRTYTPIYINGFLPHIKADILDKSVSVGIKGTSDGWNIDFSNTWGTNSMNYTVDHSLNATLLSNSPTSFNAGGFNFTQNTVNLDIDKYFGNALAGINVAYGAEFRLENYQIVAGATNSYASYDTAMQVITTPYQVAPVDFFGNTRPGGAQVFPGFNPDNALSKYRNSIAAYGDIETNFTKRFHVDAAIRYENYSDFGSTFTWKLASLLKATKNLNFRASVNTGFRAPSLQQIYFNSTSTRFVDAIPRQVGTFSNDSKVARLLGIPKLKQELSQSVSLGLTANIPAASIKLTVDGYMIWIQNRIVLTGLFNPTTPELQTLFNQAGADQASFFANAIDTKSSGLDVVLQNNLVFSPSTRLANSLSGTFSATKRVGSVHASKVLEQSGQVGTYFDKAARIYLEDAVPHTKITLSNTYYLHKFVFFLRNVYFGK
ncbi:MAG: TonB-dependent receptor, partial [Ignavibacteriaceae bacterium]